MHHGGERGGEGLLGIFALEAYTQAAAVGVYRIQIGYLGT